MKKIFQFKQLLVFAMLFTLILPAPTLQTTDVAPSLPTLPSPADGASGVSTSPTLSATVSDPDTATNLTVQFWGRVHKPDFTLVVLPDSKKYTTNGLGIFNIQNQWIVDNRIAQNIVFVTSLGDVVDDFNVPQQWDVANSGFSKLEPPGIPYGIAIGNSDSDNYGLPPGTTWFNTYFPVSRFAGRSYYGGAYFGDNGNSYQLFSASGLDFIIIHLQYNLSYTPAKSDAILGWADGLLKANSNRRAIVIVHSLLDINDDFTPDGSAVFNSLKDNPNLFLMMGGHLDTEGIKWDYGDAGQAIYSLRSDYQTRANGGNGWLRLVHFAPDTDPTGSYTNQINVETYSPYLNAYETDSDSKFSLEYDMGGSSFQLLGTVTGVASGATASLPWPAPALAAGKLYQWYVTVNDGASTTTGPNWSFTTANVNSAPVITGQPASQTMLAGQTANFNAVANGYPVPTVQWQVSTNGTNWTNISGATSTVYSFTAQSTDNGKYYHAVFTNAAGSVTTTAATLGVYAAPTVTTNPANLTVNAGQIAIFTAAATGTPTPTVQWQVSTDVGVTWTNITGATSTTYSFTAQSTDNGKQYRAVFTNAAGSATTSAAVLTVNFAPAITTQPTNLTVNAGQTATFTAAANGNPVPTAQWQVSTNGTTWTNISGATLATYSFTAQSTDNGKHFRAVFTNSVGFANSNAATLTVNSAPVVTLQPNDQTVNAGQTATFTVAASGNPIPTVQWQVSTNNGISWTNIVGATSTTYSFTTQAADNNKQYHAVFTNSVGSVISNAAILTVYTIPVITIQPVSQTVNAGQMAAFTAAASGNPTPTVQWQVSANGTSWTNIAGATSTTYSFIAQAADNGKQYRAVFTNPAGSVNSNAAILTVYFAPAVTTQPSNQTVNAGGTATFTAAASGNPAPTVQWQVSPNGTTWSDISGATSSTYSFTAQAYDNGEKYRAVFTNFLGSATSNAATLTVNIAPIVTTQPNNQTVNSGLAATFTAAASGNPTPTVQWQVSINGTNWNNISGATSTTYSFITQAADNGKQYRAVFTNVVGSITSNPATLTVNFAPDVTSQPSDQTIKPGKTVSFSAAATGNPTPTVQWQVSADNGSTWADIAGATSTTYTFTAKSADNGKQYRAVFTNLVGSDASNAAVLTVIDYVLFLPVIQK